MQRLLGFFLLCLLCSASPTPAHEEQKTPELPPMSHDLILSDNTITGLSFVTALTSMFGIYGLNMRYIPHAYYNTMPKIMGWRTLNSMISGCIAIAVFMVIHNKFSLDGKTRKAINLCKSLKTNPSRRVAREALGLLNQILQHQHLNTDIEQLLVAMKKHVLKTIDMMEMKPGGGPLPQPTPQPIS